MAEKVLTVQPLYRGNTVLLYRCIAVSLYDAYFVSKLKILPIFNEVYYFAQNSFMILIACTKVVYHLIKTCVYKFEVP